MILVTGANGHFGSATISFLLKKGKDGKEVAGMVRDEKKGRKIADMGVNLRIGDYNDYQSLVEAFKGIRIVLFVSGPDPSNRIVQHENVVKAAGKAGIKHIIYTSFERKDGNNDSALGPVAESHIYTENLIRNSGMNYTIMRNNLYMESLPMFLGENVLKDGIFLPAGDGKAAFALRSEMAEAAAAVLFGSGHEDKTYFISNTEAVSFNQIAAWLSEITGKKVSYNSPNAEAFKNTLKRSGVPENYIGFSLSFANAIAGGEFNPGKSDLEKLLGRKPSSIRQFLENRYS